ncbi:class I SAM-dependent methyltransferase [Citrobacter braakii]|uniref:class I SAM-dependent methyltransferase n=1 Tax=Citrobacter braakii TaxID=57706 RepID=UPI001907055E|nr:class I SAM-dependent methyltransferase [Citrobacter braakii]MBJ9228381.1 class I SAM-dependent methyltransferase [Citrobacter braakii]
MSNPWLSIPLADYEGHMALPDVGQADMLSGELETLLAEYSPKSVAIAGCAGGNGFDKVINAGVTRLIGIDINPEYVADARARYTDQIAQLELYTLDIQTAIPDSEPVDLVYAALLFEYVNIDDGLKNIRAMCHDSSIFAALLQLPKEGAEAVTPSPYSSLKELSSLMRLVSPQELDDQAVQAGFSCRSQRIITLKSGKRFSLHVYEPG